MTNKSMIVLFVVLGMTGCGKRTSQRSVVPELERYVETFEDYLGAQIDYPVYLGQLPALVAGECVQDGNGKHVEIDIATFKVSNEAQRESLLYHELGHCTLGRKHNDSLDVNGFPASLMNSYMFNWYEAAYYSSNRASYLRELFGR